MSTSKVTTPQQRASRLIDMWTRNGVDVGDITLRVNLVDELAAAARDGLPVEPAPAAQAVGAEVATADERAHHIARRCEGERMGFIESEVRSHLRAAEHAAEARVRAECELRVSNLQHLCDDGGATIAALRQELERVHDGLTAAEYRVTNALAEADTWRRTAEKLVRERNAKPADAVRLSEQRDAAETECARLRAEVADWKASWRVACAEAQRHQAKPAQPARGEALHALHRELMDFRDAGGSVHNLTAAIAAWLDARANRYDQLTPTEPPA